MPGRSVILATGEFYHIYNRGVAHQPVFLNRADYKQALLCLSYYRHIAPPVKLSSFKELDVEQRNYLIRELERKGEKLIELISFVFMPNHIHILLKQLVDGGVSIFMGRLSNSYTKFFNLAHERSGPIFQGAFKAVHVVTDEQLIHVSRYIHLNPVVSHVIKEQDLLLYPWSSMSEFMGSKYLVDPLPVLAHFPSTEVYKDFVFDQINYGKELEYIKHLTLE